MIQKLFFISGLFKLGEEEQFYKFGGDRMVSACFHLRGQTRWKSYCLVLLMLTIFYSKKCHVKIGSESTATALSNFMTCLKQIIIKQHANKGRMRSMFAQIQIVDIDTALLVECS